MVLFNVELKGEVEEMTMHSVSNLRKEKLSARRVQTKDRSVLVGNIKKSFPRLLYFDLITDEWVGFKCRTG